MKTKSQKSQELDKSKKLLDKSQYLFFVDFSKVSTKEMKKLRESLRAAGAEFLVIKKRLLNVLFKNQSVGHDMRQMKGSVGTAFATKDMEAVSSIIYKFFAGLEVPEGSPKDMWIPKILGGYNLQGKSAIAKEEVVMIGRLPSREVLLGQLLGMLTAPVRSFMYVLDQKSKKAQ
ncbi:MAG: 50S ribosomal protein L10 [Patescibacteria group bacterium]|nr:50S ribosomal protein L10 [Patescibacteria group bacterium]